MNDSFYARIGKRWLDLFTASFGILVITPLFLLVSLAVKFSSPGPVFFPQIRVGRSGRHFWMYKFRSMRVRNAGGSQLTAAGDPRITRVGTWLRLTKIDELPQLFNVVLGQMSLIGPRPEVPEFTRYYNSTQLCVLEVRPGMTGLSANIYEEELLAQRQDKEVFYISTIMPKKLQTDLIYCRNITFLGDVRILALTFVKLLRRFHEPYKGFGHSPHTSLETQSGKK